MNLELHVPTSDEYSAEVGGPKPILRQFMANFGIESDPFLNNFSGPGFGKAPFKTCENVVYQGTKNNMGGCKGCHGVAQTAFGTDFSFLLDFGNNKPSSAPETITHPSKTGPSKVEKTKRVLKSYRKQVH